MKKNLLAVCLGMILTLSAFANTTSPDNKALQHFKETFKGAEDVSWVSLGDFEEVMFTWSGENMAVFYTQDGQYVATTRKIDFDALPLNAIVTIKKNYSGYTVTETAEVDHKEEGFGYYVSLDNGETKIILRTSSEGDISLFKKEKL